MTPDSWTRSTSWGTMPRSCGVPCRPLSLTSSMLPPGSTRMGKNTFLRTISVEVRRYGDKSSFLHPFIFNFYLFLKNYSHSLVTWEQNFTICVNASVLPKKNKAEKLQNVFQIPLQPLFSHKSVLWSRIDAKRVCHATERSNHPLFGAVFCCWFRVRRRVGGFRWQGICCIWKFLRK